MWHMMTWCRCRASQRDMFLFGPILSPPPPFAGRPNYCDGSSADTACGTPSLWETRTKKELIDWWINHNQQEITIKHINTFISLVTTVLLLFFYFITFNLFLFKIHLHCILTMRETQKLFYFCNYLKKETKKKRLTWICEWIWLWLLMFAKQNRYNHSIVTCIFLKVCTEFLQHVLPKVLFSGCSSSNANRRSNRHTNDPPRPNKMFIEKENSVLVD